MALDFYKLDSKHRLFSLDDFEMDQLAEIFETFHQWTGHTIDPYTDFKLSIENQQALITIINKYIVSTDLNKDKKKTSAILEFKGLLGYFSSNQTDLYLQGD